MFLFIVLFILGIYGGGAILILLGGLYIAIFSEYGLAKTMKEFGDLLLVSLIWAVAWPVILIKGFLKG